MPGLGDPDEYLPNLAPYSYLEAKSLTPNIGWLDAQHSFPIGEASAQVSGPYASGS
jgi:hypothetical protein